MNIRDVTFWAVMSDDFHSLDLSREARSAILQRIPFSCWHIAPGQHPEAAEMLFFPDAKRAGIAWGADSVWYDATTPEGAIRRWVADQT